MDGTTTKEDRAEAETEELLIKTTGEADEA